MMKAVLIFKDETRANLVADLAKNQGHQDVVVGKEERSGDPVIVLTEISKISLDFRDLNEGSIGFWSNHCTASEGFISIPIDMWGGHGYVKEIK